MILPGTGGCPVFLSGASYQPAPDRLPMEVDLMTDVDGWSDLADTVLTGPTMAGAGGSLLDVLARLGLEPVERDELHRAVSRRQDPAGLLLAALVTRAAGPTTSPYAAVPAADTTDTAMDAAIALAATLLGRPDSELAGALGTTDLMVLAALPADRAGLLLVDLVTRVAGLPSPARDAAGSALLALVGRLDLSRIPVSRIIQAGIPLPHLTAAILAGAAVSRLVSGSAEALNRGVDPAGLLAILDEASRLRVPGPDAGPVTAEPDAAEPDAAEPDAVDEATFDADEDGGDSGGVTTWRGPIEHRDEPGTAPSPSPQTAPPPGRTAYPRLDVDSHQPRPEVVVIDAPFDVVVGLQPRKDLGLTATGRMTFTAGEIVDLDLVLVYDPSSLRPQLDSRAHISSTDADPYPAVTLSFTALYGEDLPPQRRIGVHVLRGGKVVAVAWRTVVAVDSAADVAGAPVPASREPDLLDLTPIVDEDMPDLVLTVFRADAADGSRFVWTAYPAASGVTVPDAPNASQLDADATGFAAEIRRTIQFSQGPQSDYLELAGRSRRIGRAIPDGIQAAIHAVVGDPARQTAPTILLLTEELSVPWELAAVTPSLQTPWGGTSPFLGAHAAIGRWPMSEHKPRPTPRTSVPVTRSAVITADYTGVTGWGKLDSALAEAAEVGALFAPASDQIRPSLTSVIALLRGDPAVDLVHVALHGQFDAQGGQEGLVLLSDVPPAPAGGTAPPPKPLFLTPAQVEVGNLAAGPFVFLNACQVGADKRVLGDYGGLASTLLRIGAAAVVAPLWNVDDAVAAAIARDFYAATWTPATGAVGVAEAVRRIRATYTEAAVRSAAPGIGATLVAFQVLGHPALRLSRG